MEQRAAKTLYAAGGGSFNSSHSIFLNPAVAACRAATKLSHVLTLTNCLPVLLSVCTKCPSSSYPTWLQRSFKTVFTIIIQLERTPQGMLNSRPRTDHSCGRRRKGFLPQSADPELGAKRRNL